MPNKKKGRSNIGATLVIEVVVTRNLLLKHLFLGSIAAVAVASNNDVQALEWLVTDHTSNVYIVNAYHFTIAVGVDAVNCSDNLIAYSSEVEKTHDEITAWFTSDTL